MSDLLLVALALIMTLPRLVDAVMRYLPATIWALRAPRDSPRYCCPPLPGRRSAVSGLHDGKQR